MTRAKKPPAWNGPPSGPRALGQCPDADGVGVAVGEAAAIIVSGGRNRRFGGPLADVTALSKRVHLSFS